MGGWILLQVSNPESERRNLDIAENFLLGGCPHVPVERAVMGTLDINVILVAIGAEVVRLFLPLGPWRCVLRSLEPVTIGMVDDFQGSSASPFWSVPCPDNCNTPSTR